MLYPLSYEGLACPFSQHAGANGDPSGRGWLPRSRRSVPHLCRASWSSATTLTRRADWTAGGVEPRGEAVELRATALADRW